jgi:hypothetical protein
MFSAKLVFYRFLSRLGLGPIVGFLWYVVGRVFATRFQTPPARGFGVCGSANPPRGHFYVFL